MLKYLSRLRNKLIEAGFTKKKIESSLYPGLFRARETSYLKEFAVFRVTIFQFKEAF